MTPRELDPDVAQARLGLLAELLEDLDSVGHLTARELQDDRMLRHAVERILSQVVELAVAINSHVAVALGRKAPQDYRDSFRLAAECGIVDQDLAARLRPSVGLRNILAHEYVAIDLELVVRGADLARTDYREYVRQVAGWLKQQ